MRHTKKKKNTLDNLHPEDRAKAAAAFSDLFWLLQSLELLSEEDVTLAYEGIDCDVPEYVSTFGIPDAQLS